MINENSVEFKKFLRRLVQKSIKGKDYYYYRIDNPILEKSKQIYIGKYTKAQQSLLQYYLKKIYFESQETFQEILRKEYKYTSLTPSLTIFLDMLRYSFHFSMREFSRTDIEKYESKNYTRYVHGTTSVEGNTYTLQETNITLNEGRTVKGKNNQEFYEIDNYRRWKNYLKTGKEFKITIDGIKKMHEILLANIDDIDVVPGEFRNVPAFITGTDFQPTPHILITEELQELIAWYENSKEEVHPIELISQFHLRFEMIHPFSDGNGRVGREIMRLQLTEFGFPSIFISNTNRDDYLMSLDRSLLGDYSYITSYIASQVIREAIGSLDEYAEFMTDLFDTEQFIRLQKRAGKNRDLLQDLTTVMEKLNSEIKDKITILLSKLDSSNQVFVDVELMQRLDRIIQEPFIELRAKYLIKRKN